MTSPDAERQEHPLGRYWNAVAAGGPAQPDDLDPTLAETVRHLQAIGAAPTPDPAFAADLWEDLMRQAHAASPPLPRLLPGPLGSPPRGAPGAERAPALRRALSPGRWWPRLEFVAIALLTVALVAGLVAMNGGIPDPVGSFVGQGDDPDTEGTLPGPMGSVVEIGDDPVDILVHRVVLAPGAGWETPAVFTIETLQSGSLVSRPDIPGASEDRMRVGEGSSGTASSSTLRNDQSEPAVLFQALIGPDLRNLRFPAGVAAEVLGIATVNTLPAGQAYASIEEVLLAPSDQLEIDTGRDGLAFVMVEEGTLALSGAAGRIEFERAADEAEEPTASVDPRRPPQSVSLTAGDTALLQGGAFFSVWNDTDDRVRALLLTVNPGAAQTQVMTGESESIVDAVYGTPPVEEMEGSYSGPAGTPTADAEVVPSDNCDVAPRSAESLEDLRAAGQATNRSAEDLETSRFRYEDELPQGTPLDAATLAAITEVEREFAACLNAGDWPRGLALLSDDIVRDLLAEEDGARFLSATPEPLLPDERIGLFPLRGGRTLPDGRVAAIVDWGQVGFADGPTSVSESNFRIYERVEGRWLIAEEISTGR